MIGCRTELGSQMRGLLAEYGIVIPVHMSQLRRFLPLIIEEDSPLLTGLRRRLFAFLYEELCALEERIGGLEKQLQRVFQRNELCRGSRQ